MSDYETLLTERRGGIVTIRINRPASLNALNMTVFDELAQVVESVADDAELDAVVLTGEGRAFVAGADIKAMVNYDHAQAQEFSRRGHQVMGALSKLPVPVLAAVNGFALGGGLELALSCDLLYGSTKAKLGLPEVSLAVIPGWGGTQRLGRLIGWHAARELLYTGKMIDAEEARQMGLLLDVFEPEELMDRVYEIAELIASRGPLAVRKAKALVTQGAELSLEEAFALEQRAFGELFGTNDQVEGMKAHLERRDPEFTRS